eukprot:764100-Hanusia_phi.AAC.2
MIRVTNFSSNFSLSYYSVREFSFFPRILIIILLAGLLLFSLHIVAVQTLHLEFSSSHSSQSVSQHATRLQDDELHPLSDNLDSIIDILQTAEDVQRGQNSSECDNSADVVPEQLDSGYLSKSVSCIPKLLVPLSFTSHSSSLPSSLPSHFRCLRPPSSFSSCARLPHSRSLQSMDLCCAVDSIVLFLLRVPAASQQLLARRLHRLRELDWEWVKSREVPSFSSLRVWMQEGSTTGDGDPSYRRAVRFMSNTLAPPYIRFLFAQIDRVRSYLPSPLLCCALLCSTPFP